jgi:hypothetical protein
MANYSQEPGCGWPPGLRIELSAFSLIEIKAGRRTISLDGTDEPDGVRSMPTEIIVIVTIVAAFCVFAGALYWGDLQTRERGNAEHSPRQ